MTILINPNNVFDGFLKSSALWEERYPAGEHILKSPDKWIHFTDVDMLEVNPEKQHKDPEGIYFYQARWLLDNYRGFQYGMSKPHAYIADIKTKGSNGIDLRRASWEKARAIARSNGWEAYFNLAAGNPKQFLSGNQMDQSNWNKPGGVLYGAADGLANVPEIFGLDTPIPWSQTMAGLDYIKDSGAGIIASGEPYQLIVLNPSIIKNAQYIDNTPDYQKMDTMIATEVMKSLGGSVEPAVDHMVGRLKTQEGSPVEIDFSLGEFYRFNIKSFQNGILMNEPMELQGHEWDDPLEYQIRSIVYKIKEYLKKNPPDQHGVSLVWDRERLSNLADDIGFSGSRRSQYIENDEYVLWGYAYSKDFRFTTNKNGQLKVEFNHEFKGVNDFDIKFEKVYNKNTDEREIVKEIKDIESKYIEEYQKRYIEENKEE